MLLTCMSIARAEAVTVYLEDEDGVKYKSYETELTKGADGVYTLANFLNTSNTVFSFTFDESIAVDASAAIELKCNLNTEDSPYVYILNGNNKYPKGKIYSADGTEITFRYPAVYLGASYTYVMRVDKAEYGYDYYACFTINGIDVNDKDLPYYDLYFYFNAIDAGESAEDTTIGVTVESEGAYYYPSSEDYSKYDEIKSFKSFDAQLVIAADGTHTLKNIFNTDYSISYKVGDFTDQTAPVTFTGNITADKGYEEYPYFMNGTNYMTVTMQVDGGDSSYSVEYFYGYENVKYTYVYKSSAEEIAKGYYEYYVYLNLGGYVGSTGVMDSYWVYGYNMHGSGDSGVAKIVDDSDAPVEFYNLQGIKVANPSNGIYIRKQGSKVKKVVIR